MTGYNTEEGGAMATYVATRAAAAGVAAAAGAAAAVAGYEQGHIDLPKAGRGYASMYRG